MINAIGARRLEISSITGGSAGIDCSSSFMSIRTVIGEITAEYQIEVPVPVFLIKGSTRTESIKIKAWTGYEKELLGNASEEIVYITETGLVYHRDYHCTYLDLSIRMVNLGEVESLRNEDGGRYYACWLCGSGNG